MKPELEQYLELEVRRGVAPRDVIAMMLNNGMISSAKQAWSTLRKWSDKGKYSYGVALDLGWMVGDSAISAAVTYAFHGDAPPDLPSLPAMPAQRLNPLSMGEYLKLNYPGPHTEMTNKLQHLTAQFMNLMCSCSECVRAREKGDV